MKKSDLKEYIKTRIRETLYAGPAAVKTVATNPEFSKVQTADRAKILQKLQKGGSVELGEVELDEMARKATLFDIDPEYRSKAASIQTGGPINPQKLADVLDFLEGKEMVTGPEIAAAVGFEGKMPRIYAIFAALQNVGALTPTTEEETVEIPDTPENEDVDNILGEPEEAPEVEPEMPTEPDEASLEKATISADTDSQKAAMFTVDNADLISKIIRVYKDSRTRIGEILREEEDLSPGDYKKAIKQSKEASLDKLSDLVKELAKKIDGLDPQIQEKVLDTLDFKFNSVNATHLSKLVFDKLGKQYEEKPEVTDGEFEDIDDEEISEDVSDVDYGGDDFKDYDSVYERMNKLVNYKG
jgi:hypothetical protein